jgi:4-diphosphocytidyl-2-C-methyl-D-erythritol kinase
VTTIFTRTTRAKLNLSLTITGKRADGYHLLQSVVAFCEVGDVITASPAPALSLRVSGRFAESIQGNDNNLVFKAARLLQTYTNTAHGAALHLEKNLPIASGMGGGSGDAAATLRLLNQLWECGLSEPTLTTLATSLGADVPVCLYEKSCWMEGVGERITPLSFPLPSLYAVLINPLIPLPTPAVFTQLCADEWSGEQSRDISLNALHNDLTAAAIRICPAIGDILTALRYTQPISAGMSGSGATCFGLYGTETEASAASASMQQMYPHYWVGYGRLH